MLNSLHWKLTIICTAITSIIVILMTVFSIGLSENGLQQKEHASFINYVNSIYSHLEIETTITMEWVRNTEKNGLYDLAIEDNGKPLEAMQQKNKDSLRILGKARSIAAASYQLDISGIKPSQVLLKHTEFALQDQGKDYYASVGYIPREYGAMNAVIVYPLDNFHQSIILQRCFYAAAVFLAILSLFIFSYFFTKKAVHKVEESQIKQTQFIAAASHELRSPLTVIRSSLSAIKKADTHKAERFETIIEQEIDRMTRLISDMLFLARTGNHSWTLNQSEVDMISLIRDVYDSYQEIAAGKKLILQLQIPDRDITVNCDKQRIEQVLHVLLNNAVSYTPEGGTITLSCREKGHKCILTVADTGPGIPEKHKRQIFERFYRMDSSHKSKDHFGLGLCIAMEIMKLHRGTIDVADTPGGGATFNVILGR